MNKHIGLVFGAALALTPLLGGCPNDFLPPGTDPTGDSFVAGEYWLDEREGALAAFKLPERRDEQTDWTALSKTPDWFVGPGLYEISRAGDVEMVASADDVTLDEVLALHDPAP